MSKRSVIALTPVLFLICAMLVVFFQLSKEMKELKTQHSTNDSSIDEVNQDNKGIKNTYNDTNTEKSKNEEKDLLWEPIERKNSYNNELQFYTKENVVIGKDLIEITSRKEEKESKTYTSGLVESTWAYKYGHFKFTIEISEGKGIFPAIWLLPTDGDVLPEIDVFEMIGSETDTFYGVIHFSDSSVQKLDYFNHQVPEKDKYTVSLEWAEDSITWYIDNQEIYSTGKGVPQEYMYIIINQAIGGDWPGNPDDNTIFPNKFVVSNITIEPVFKKGRN